MLGVHSGTPANAVDGTGHADSQPGPYPAHYGMVMAFIQSTQICTGTATERALLKSVNVDLGLDGTSNTSILGCQDHLPPIVVRATAQGLTSGSIAIPLTSDSFHSPLAVAKRSNEH